MSVVVISFDRVSVVRLSHCDTAAWHGARDCSMQMRAVKGATNANIDYVHDCRICLVTVTLRLLFSGPVITRL